MIRKAVQLASMIVVPLVAHAGDGLPPDYVAAMAHVQGNLVARAAECGFASERSADVRRIAMLGARNANLPPEEGLANTEYMATVRRTIQNRLFANTDCAMVRVTYNGFESAPSSVAGPWTSSPVGTNLVEQLRVALLQLEDFEQASMHVGGSGTATGSDGPGDRNGPPH
jgi:hypothetical protein